MRKGGEGKKSALTNAIYLNLKEMISSGYLKPYETLNLVKLAKHFKVSVTPVNSALSVLSEEGLVSKEPNKSFVVAAMSMEEIQEIWLIGALQEGMAAYLATSRITSQEIRHLERVLRNTKETKVPDDILKLKELNKDFHGTIIRACGNRELLALTKEYSWKLYRYYYLVLSLPGAFSEFVEMHKLIFENLKKKDPRGTRDAMEKHIISAGEKVINYLKIGLLQPESCTERTWRGSFALSSAPPRQKS
jgi:DNA-binding GntR family transcriptional regulator